MIVGIDISNKTFTATLLDTPQKLVFYGEDFDNTPEGFKALLKRVRQHATLKSCTFVMDNAGVYGERLCYFLHDKTLTVSVEPAHYVRRAFRLKGKTDKIDSRMIAEYGYRYADQLHHWSPPPKEVEQIRILLNNYDLVQKEITAHNNNLKALSKKERTLSHLHQESLDFLKAQANSLLKLIKTEMQAHDVLACHTTNLLTIPGVGPVFCAKLCVITGGFVFVNYRNLAGYLGICPHPFESGQSVYKKPKSDKKGPDSMRKQLYISAVGLVRTKDNPFKDYYHRKVNEGKSPKVVLNNIENKLLRTACAVILSGKPYNPKFKPARKKL